MNSASISVVIPLHNNENSIVDAINSIQRQSVKVNEIVVVDDGSSDGSVERVAALQIPNLKLIKQASLGLAAARNRGITESSSRYVAFLDATDQWMPFFTLEMHTLFTRFPDLDLFASRYQFIEKNGMPVDASVRFGMCPKEAWLMHDFLAIAARGDAPFVTSSCVVKRELFNALGMFPAGEAIGAECTFFAKASLAGAIAYSPNILVHHRRGALSRVSDVEPYQNVLSSCERLLGSLNSSPIARIVANDIQQYCASLLFGFIKSNLAAKRYQQALALLGHPLCKQKPALAGMLKAAAYTGRLSQFFTGSGLPNPKEKLL